MGDVKGGCFCGAVEYAAVIPKLEFAPGVTLAE